VKSGRGSPHGGVFLDIAWIKSKISKSEDHIKKKLPSMYHQFKTLAGIDITKESMEVGPTTHYVMGGVRVEGDTQMSTVPGLFAAGEVSSGMHGANRLGGNSLSDLIVFGKRAGEHAAKFAKENGGGGVDQSHVEEAARRTLEPFDRKAGGESPYQVQYALQDMMQDLVGIVRVEEEMARALDGIQRLKPRAAAVGISAGRAYNPGWHTAIDLASLLVVAEAVTRAALERRESRGAQFREDYPAKSDEYGKFNFVVSKGEDGQMQVRREAVPQMPAEMKQVIEENK
jgi:succinate dehydrogenase / fumarate reductase, flavoprotein subunit